MWLFDWIGYQLVMHGGRFAIDAKTRLGRWCLVQAGGWAYRDHARSRETA